MTDHKKKEQIETEVTYQTLSEFLQNTPPNKFVHISDLVDPYSTLKRINAPELILYCSHESCNGDRFFRCLDLPNNRQSLNRGTLNYLYIRYQCDNCKNTRKIYSLAAIPSTIPCGICSKLGELPQYGPPISPKLIRLIQPEKDIFMQGRKCENQGLGIGAFTYYRRVVESQKNRILEEIVKASEKSGVPQDKIDILRAAIEEIQFSKALRMARDVIPDSLLINGQNPILLLHHALSRGVHELSDEQCLKLASTIRLVLGELSERLSVLLKDKAALTKAISTLMQP